MSDFRGDYMGFTYNGIHSSDLGIVRISDGSRFNENLLPTMQDKTVQVPGGDGTYYFGSYYKQRQFNVSFAFDNLTEKQVAELKRVFSDKKIHELIFDERPYKVWDAKVTGTATIKYIPFNEGEGRERVYKGEGSIQFTCYNPFARCYSDARESYYTHPAYRIKDSEGNIKTSLTNEEKRKIDARIDEWWEASRIVKGVNFGDVPVPFKLEIYSNGTLYFGDESISWDLPSNYDETNMVVLDTKLGLAKDQSNNILNPYIAGNLMAKIPVGVGWADDSISIENDCGGLYFNPLYI